MKLNVRGIATNLRQRFVAITLRLVSFALWPLRSMKQHTAPEQSWSDFALLAILLTLFLVGLVLIPVAAIYTWSLWQGQEQTISDLSQQTSPPVDAKDLAQLTRDLSDTFVRAATATVQLAGAIVIGLGLYFTRRQVMTSEANLRYARETLETTRQGQLNDRFAKAIEQLGDKDSITMRLGGIYALEGIARQSDDLYWPVMEVLVAYLRQFTYLHGEQSPSEYEPSLDNLLFPRRRLPTDVQAVFTVLGRRRKRYGDGEDERLDLRRTNWNSMDLNGVTLISVDFDYADLTMADLGITNFPESHFREADLSRADLIASDLHGAFFFGAILVGTTLASADLSDANLRNANLRDAYLIEANLSGADLSGADLSGADLSDADLSWVSFYGETLGPTRGLTAAQLRSARTYEGAILPPELRAELDADPKSPPA